MSRPKRVITKPKKEKWTRADKINGFVAAVALLTAIVPLAKNLYGYLHRPTVTISSPPSNFITGSKGFDVTGTSQNIPGDDDLWLLVRAPGNFWFPIAKVNSSGPWSVTAHMICFRMGPGLQDLQVWMIPDTADGPLISYMNKSNSTSPVTQLPPGSTLETHVAVQVPNNIRVSC